MNITFESPDHVVTVAIDGIGRITLGVSEWEVGDDGIGGYECHGTCGNDSRTYPEFVDFEVLELNGVKVSDTQAEELRKYIEGAKFSIQSFPEDEYSDSESW